MPDFEKIIEWLKDYWTKLALSLIVILGAIIVVLILKLISIKIKKRYESRASKITSLIYEIIKFLLLIFAMFIILAIWDFDTTIGIILFAIVVFVIGVSLIPTIHDVIVGIGNIFNGTYDEGDIVEINGYRGKVVNFTIVKTQLKGKNGEIKTISNSEIKDVINYSSDYLTASAFINVTELGRIEEIKKIIDDSLSNLKDEYNEIVEGPNFNGLEKFENGVATFKLSCKVKANDYSKVMKGMQNYILDITIKHNIK